MEMDDLSFRRRLRRKQTHSEKLLWQQLRNRALTHLKFRRQVSFGKYVVDFYCPELKLVIELDGNAHDGRKKYDETRDLHLRCIGLHVMRFKNDVLYEEPELIHRAILDYFYEIYPHLYPLPLRERTLPQATSNDHAQ
jgi:very-short-patch-repair endonuclease